MFTDKSNKNSGFDELVENFIAKPEEFALYGGEGSVNQNEVHFTTDRKWADGFGRKIISGRLSIGATIKVITWTIWIKPIVNES